MLSFRDPWVRRSAFLVLVLLNALLLAIFHNRSWIPPDEFYANVAERVLDGEGLNTEVEELHPGYINLIHAAALAVFGRDLVSLRYPLVALTLLQSCWVFRIFRGRGLPRALTASLAVTAFGFLQVANPTPSLYGLFLVVAIFACLVGLPREARWRLEVVGLLTGLVFLFRQLTGVFVGMGVLGYLLVEASDSERRGSVTAARCLIGVMFLALGAYLVKSTDAVGFFLIGVWPLAVLCLSWYRTTASDPQVARMLARLTVGALVGTVPLLGYHVWHGSLGAWVNDCFIRALSVGGLQHLSWWGYEFYMIGGARNLLLGPGVVPRLNGVYWIVLPLLSVINGSMLLRFLMTNRKTGARDVVVPFVTVFYALVSVFIQIPCYLYLSVGLSIVSLLWFTPVRVKLSWAWPVAGAGLCLIGVVFHAGQPYTRLFNATMSGQRVGLAPSNLQRSSLLIDPAEARMYQQLVSVIQEGSRADEPIFVLPNNAELYFLSQRHNPFRMFNTTLGLVSEQEVEDFTTGRLVEDVPRLVIHNAECKYNTPLTAKLMDSIKTRYTLVEEVEGFDIYRIPD